MNKKEAITEALSASVADNIAIIKSENNNFAPNCGRVIDCDTIIEFIANCGIVNNSLKDTILTFALADKMFSYELDRERAEAKRAEKEKAIAEIKAKYANK